MSLRNRLIFNVKWHRRLGLFCAFFVLVLSITGLLLNHTSSLKLDSIKLQSSLLSSLYNLPSANPVSFQANNQWVSHDGLSTLYLGQQPLEQCTPPLKGAINHAGLLVVLCHQQLILFTPEGELLERISPIFGLPDNSDALASLDDKLFIQSGNNTLNADIDSLQFNASTTKPDWVSPKSPPTELTDFLTSKGPTMDLEQVLLDLHSGRLFGGIGVFIMDLVAVLLIILSITGFIAWHSSRKMRARISKNTSKGAN